MSYIGESTKIGEKRMESGNLQDEIRAYREVLQKERLTEIDLDALNDCLADVEGVLRESYTASGELKLLRNDLVGEIVRLATASEALKDGAHEIDTGTFTGKLENLDAARLLSVRERMRTAFANLQRKEDFPRKVVSGTQAANSIEDYKIDNARV